MSKAKYVVAVIGHPGVGKSTVIRRATKSWGISIPVSIETPGGHRGKLLVWAFDARNTPPCLHLLVSSCFSQIQAGGNLRNACKVEFLEMGIDALDLSGGPSGIWPSFVAPVSGVVVCYDSGDRESLKGIKETLREYQASVKEHLLPLPHLPERKAECPTDILAPTGMPIVLFATKSDEATVSQVDPAHGNSVGEPYNVGLIEVTATDAEGKSKIRNGFRWLLYKLEQGERKSPPLGSLLINNAPC